VNGHGETAPGVLDGRNATLEVAVKTKFIFLRTRSISIHAVDMQPLQRVSLPERVAAHLRVGIRQGHWGDRFPGVPLLAGETRGDIQITYNQ
jgi:hypothetical protein